MKTTNVEKNLGPASIIIVNGEKNLEAVCGIIMGEEDVKQNPLGFPTEAQVHDCEFDADKGIARRKYKNRIEKANFEIMKAERDTRKAQGRTIEVVPEIPKITGELKNTTIDENGEIVRSTVVDER